MMNRQFGFFTFAVGILAAFLLFQVTTGCGRQNLLPGSPSAFLLGREAYYRGEYETALTYLNRVTAEGSSATSAERRDAGVFMTRVRLAQAGSDLISTIQDTVGNLDLSGSRTQEVGSIQSQLVSTNEATRQQVRAAADSINELVRTGDISTQDAIAMEVALVNAQAAAARLTDSFDSATRSTGGACATCGNGVLEPEDVQDLSAGEVAELWQEANGGSTQPGAAGGITEYLQNAMNFGGGAVGDQLGISSDALGTSEASVDAINQMILNGEVTGADLARFLGGGGGN